MITPLHALARSEDCADILSDILRLGRARPGLTLVVAIELATGQLAGIIRLSTPKPPEGSDAPAILAGQLSPFLVETLAFFDACQPGGSPACVTAPPSYEVVTIVCRDGDLTPSASEEQFALAWRSTSDWIWAQCSDVYVVTPQGWACLAGGGGAVPWLEIAPDRGLPDDDVIELPPLVDPDALACDPAVLAAESVLAEALEADFATLAAVRPRECLACYVTRMVAGFGCDGSFRFADHFRAVRAPGVAVERQRWRRLGVCDCAVYVAGYDLADHVAEPVEETDRGGVPVVVHHEWPWPSMPPCEGTRRGSTKPCSLWQPLPVRGW